MINHQFWYFRIIETVRKVTFVIITIRISYIARVVKFKLIGNNRN